MRQVESSHLHPSSPWIQSQRHQVEFREHNFNPSSFILYQEHVLSFTFSASQESAQQGEALSIKKSTITKVSKFEHNVKTDFP